MAKKEAHPPLTNNEIRSLMLRYFYDRNHNATSVRGKRGSSVKISDLKRDMKASHGLTQQEVQSNLTYLISQGWVEEDAVEKSFTAPGGTVIPSTTHFYRITAAGIDKIEGPGRVAHSSAFCADEWGTRRHAAKAKQNAPEGRNSV